MILYDLKCAKGHVFEAWFRDSGTYERQEKAGRLECPDCGSRKVARAPMAPSIVGPKERARPPADAEAAAKARELLQQLRQEVERNCDYVGDGFAEEARRIHYGETDPRGIYGEASDDEARELVEEGIPFGRVPWLPRTDS